LAILTVAAVVAALIAVRSANEANSQARIATARALASSAVANLDNRLDVAQLLAVQAYRMNPNPQTRSALLEAATASPWLARYLPMGGQVAELAGSGDGRTVVAGLGDGRVQRWNLDNPQPQTILTLRAGISGLAVSSDGAVVVASDGTEALLWRRGQAAAKVKGPPGQQAGAVTVSPSGRTAVVYMSEPTFEGPQSTVIVDVPSGGTRATHAGPADASKGLASVSSLVASSDDQLFLLSGYGAWERRRILDWKLEATSNPGFGAHTYAIGTADDGGSFTQTNGSKTIPVWRTDRPSDYYRPGFTAEAPISLPGSLTLSPDGTKLAVADSGAIYLAPVAREGAERPEPVRLTGNGSINPTGSAFSATTRA
jgi:WD40 repeat protein